MRVKEAPAASVEQAKRPTRRRLSGVAVICAAAAIGLAGCGGGPTGSAHVASLATTSDKGGGSTTTLPSGNATRLLDEWATCMRSNGDPNQSDPTIDSDKDIQIWIDTSAGNEQLSNEVHSGTAPCNQYLVAAQMALRNGEPFPQPPSAVQEVQFAECMRANGFPTWPNPSGPDDSETNFNGTGIDPNSSQVSTASNKCDNKLGIHDVANSAQGDAGDIQVGSGPSATPRYPSGNGAPGGLIPKNGGVSTNSGSGASG